MSRKTEKNGRTLYVSDLDGTLLNNDSVLSTNTIDILNSLIKERHIFFTIATARTPATVVKLMKDVRSFLPYIVMSGAALWDNYLKIFEMVRVIDNRTIRQLLRIYEHYPINPFIYRRHDNMINVHHVKEITDEEWEFICPRLSPHFKRLSTFWHINPSDPDEAMLVFSMGDYVTLSAIYEEIKQKELPCTCSCYRDIFDNNKGILEIYAQKTSKAEAVMRMARQLRADRIVVFGDNLNDLPMMAIANHSIAVNNAFVEVKEKADEVIGNNDDDAVARWILSDINK